MFGSLFRRKKSNQKDVANTGAPDPSQQSVPGASDDATFSGTPSKPEKTAKTKKTWKSRLLSCFIQKKKKKSCNSEAEASETTAPQSTKKRFLWPFQKKKNQVSPATVSEVAKSDPKTAADKTSSSISKAKVLEGGETMTPTMNSTSPLGFPNIGNSCYMNSCLQSLFSLEDFINDISRQKNLWSSVPDAEFLRQLADIRDCHESTDYDVKASCLCHFKSAFAAHAPQYSDTRQKDAHEFLTLLMSQIKLMSPHLQKCAAVLGQSYTCPVKYHFSFQMENMRTCKSCGLQSSHQEDFTNLSLDLVPESSITAMLEAYLKEEALEFRCECGGTTSGLELSFDNLPRVLILHLKRFHVTQSHKVEKLHDPIRLDRNLIISSKEGGACYNLVSIISHNGETEMGHYTCNAIHPSESLQSPTDRWMTFNDKRVSETTGSAVCEEQQHLAYVLFYMKIV